jgi:hypothetical protein
MGIPFLHLQRQPRHAAAHIRVAGGNPDPDVRRNGDHRNPFSVAATRTDGAFAVRLTRAPPGNSTTMAKLEPSAADRLTSSTSTAGANPIGAGGTRDARRHL